MRRWFWIAAVLAALVLASQFLAVRYSVVNGHLYSREATVLKLPEGVGQDAQRLTGFPHLRWLDLRGARLSGEEYDALARTLPGCRMVWELSFQNRNIPSWARHLEITHLADGEVAQLDYLEKLDTVDATACQDYAQLLALARRRPDCRVLYNVELGGKLCSCEEDSISPGACTPAQLEWALPLLPRIRRVDLRATGLSHEQAAVLADEFPQIRFLWEITMGDVIFPTDAVTVDLSGVVMENTQQVEELLPYLPNVEKIVMCDCGIPSPEMAALNDRYPDIRFVWRVKLGPLSARTDDTWFAPITHRQLIGGHDADELKYCTDMECIDLGHCWIRDCEWARNMKNLRYLVLADTYVRDLSPLSELKNLAYLELFVTPVRDYSPLLGCTGLEDLNLGYTYGDPTPISQMPWLKNLWWGGLHYVPWVGGSSPAAMLQNGLPNTNLMFYAGSSTGMGWRNLPHYYEMRDIIGMYYMRG